MKKRPLLFFSKNTNLEDTCNAPKSGIGVYLVYELKNGRPQIVYVGSSSKVLQNGKTKESKDGIWGSITNEIQFEKPRMESWAIKVANEKIDALEIYWYETLDEVALETPSFLQAYILNLHFSYNDELPRWNIEF